MFPAQALAESLKADGWEIALMTDVRGGRHAGAIPADPLITVSAATLSPRKPIKAAIGTLKLMAGVRQARKFIKNWKPDVVIGFGGYPAFPAMQAAKGLKLPYIVHEQNAVLGRVNRLFAKHAAHVVSGFDRLDKLPEGASWTALGNPLREKIAEAAKREYKAPTSRSTINLLIVGGSLGATIVSRNVPQAIALLPDNLRKRLSVVQQARESDITFARKIYVDAGVKAECSPFFSNIDEHLAKAHFVIGRAGAGSVTEIAAMGLPSLLVPLAIAMDDHQTVNALTLKGLGAAEVLPESEFTPERIKDILWENIGDPDRLKTASEAALKAAKPDATARLAELVKGVVGTPS